uniref:Uncharacterized protein n=1 Tax=Molossus molossus TaxID=27622 RepID=A0A7J8GKR5_MOLMO|nr:hypothetical protein HJG59_011435 [Molossus molossus]
MIPWFDSSKPDERRRLSQRDLQSFQFHSLTRKILLPWLWSPVGCRRLPLGRAWAPAGPRSASPEGTPQLAPGPRESSDPPGLRSPSLALLCPSQRPLVLGLAGLHDFLSPSLRLLSVGDTSGFSGAGSQILVPSFAGRANAWVVLGDACRELWVPGWQSGLLRRRGGPRLPRRTPRRRRFSVRRAQQDLLVPIVQSNKTPFPGLKCPLLLVFHCALTTGSGRDFGFSIFEQQRSPRSNYQFNGADDHQNKENYTGRPLVLEGDGFPVLQCGPSQTSPDAPAGPSKPNRTGNAFCVRASAGATLLTASLSCREY